MTLMGPTSPPSLILHALTQSIPSNMVTMAEVPPGAEEKNRYKDVLPSKFPPSLLFPLFLPPSQLFGMTRISSSDAPTRVSLFLKFGVANSDYINANFIRVGKYDTQH